MFNKICPECKTKKDYRIKTRCQSCAQKLKWKDKEYRERILKQRRSQEYRKMMSESMKNSQAWKDTEHLRNEGCRKYWEGVRGHKFEDIKDPWYLYRRTVYKMTEKNYRKHEDVINPGSVLRGRGKYHVDHKYSVMEGFKNNIPPYVISHQSNLQMLRESLNISKDFRCDITKEELFKEVFAH